MKGIKLIFIFCLLYGQLFSQTAKEKYQQAQLAYDAGKYADALYYLGETENALGGTNARIQSLKTLVYYDQGDKEKAAIELAKYFRVVSSSMEATEGYKNMLDLQKELKTTIENNFNEKKKKAEVEHQKELNAIAADLAHRQEEYYYNLIKNCEYPQAIRDFINKYPKSSYNPSLESKISRISKDIDKQTNPGLYLVEALQTGNQTLVDKLLSYGCNVNVKGKSGKYAVHVAVAKSDLANLKKLFYAGANINLKDENGRTPLSLAVEKENLELVDFLINTGADLNKKDNKNEGPVFYAIRANSLTLIQKLITYGAVLTEKNTTGYTPLVVAILQDHIIIAIVQSLLHQGVYVNRLVNANTPIYYATYNNKNELVEMLLKYNANPNIKSSDDFTMLSIATTNSNIKMMKILLYGKANPNQTSANNFCPLHYTVFHNQLEATKLLLLNGASANIKGLYGWTPLHFACREQNVEMVKLLLANNADKNIKDVWGRRPKKIARERHFKNIKKLL